jgi:hypothetical protein
MNKKKVTILDHNQTTKQPTNSEPNKQTSEQQNTI